MTTSTERPVSGILDTTRSVGGAAFWCCGLGVALAEGSIGWWLRHLPLGVPDGSTALTPWLLALLALLAARVGLSWGRDRSLERAALLAGDRFARGLWTRRIPPDQAPWLAREGREAVEQGTRAALVLAASALALAVLVPAMVWFSPPLSCALLVLAPFLSWAGRRRWRAARAWAADEQNLLSRHALDETWGWRAAREARASGIGHALSVLRRRASTALARRRLDVAHATVAGQAGTEAAAHVAGWLLAALALLSWDLGAVSAPDLLAFLAAALLAYRPIREAGRALPAWHRMRAVQERSIEAPSEASPPHGRSLAARGLVVRADDGTILVDGPTFELRPGETFLLSGANGAGKTSLLEGLLGWKRCEGVLARPACLRALAQEPVLPPLSPARWSGVADPSVLPLLSTLFPSGLPCPWDAPLPDGGTRLSRGERARLALLCLTATPADLWILDEPFSALPMAERADLLGALRSVQGEAALLFSDPLSLDPRDAHVVWEAGPGQRGPRIYRL